MKSGRVGKLLLLLLLDKENIDVGVRFGDTEFVNEKYNCHNLLHHAYKILP